MSVDGRESHGPTPRELQILELVSQGKSYGEVGAILGISRVTVGSVMSRLSMNDSSSDKAYFAMIKRGSQRLALRLWTVYPHLRSGRTL